MGKRHREGLIVHIILQSAVAEQSLYRQVTNDNIDKSENQKVWALQFMPVVSDNGIIALSLKVKVNWQWQRAV